MLEDTFNWINQNKEWLFSGIGVVIGAWIIRSFFRKHDTEPRIKSGKNSTNVIAGGNVEIAAKKKSPNATE